MSEILSRKTIRPGLTATGKTDATMQCGFLLVAVDAVTQPYTDVIFERGHQVPIHLGEGVAILHGTNELRGYIQHTCLGFLQFPGGVDWDGEWVFVCILIASHSEEYVKIFGEFAEVLMNPDAAVQLRTTTNLDNVLRPPGAFGKED